MAVTLRHKRDFQAYMCRIVGKSERDMFAQCSLEDRLAKIVRECEFYTRGVYENDLPREYNPASYGLLLTVQRGLINGETYLALKAMTFRQLCGVVYDLLAKCGDTPEHYAHTLMRWYTKKA